MNKKILLYVLIFILLAILVLFTVFPQAGYAIKDFRKSGSSDSGDICKAPEGVSQESWNTHMGHHPNIYAECLN